MTECQIGKWDSCCCNCEYQHIDRSHPGTDGKAMSATRGYICAEPFLGSHSGWSEHGMCECWTERPAKPEEIEGDANSHYLLEAWDAAYQKRDAMPTWWALNKK